MSDNDEFLSEFITEAREHLANAEEQLLANNDEAVDIEAMDSCFRSLHTVKGGAGFLDLQRVLGVAHVAEQLLEEIKNGNIPSTGDRIDGLLQAVSHLSELVQDENIIQGAPLTNEDNVIIEQLHVLLGNASSDASDDAADEAPVEAAATDETNTDNTEQQHSDIEQTFEELCAIANGDVPGLIRVIERLDRSSQEMDWCNESHDLLHQIQQQCDEAMFADADAQLQLFDNIRDVAQQLREIVLAAQVQGHIDIEDLVNQIIDLEHDNIPALIQICNTLMQANQQEQWPPAQFTLLQNIQAIGDNIMFADGPGQEQGFEQIRHLAHELLALCMGNDSSDEAFVHIATDFIPETSEILSRVEDTILQYDHPTEQHISEVLRNLHTVKGIASYVGLADISELIHGVETSLSSISQNAESYNQVHKDIILNSVDAVRSLSKHAAREGSDAGHWPENALHLCLEIGLQDLHQKHLQGATIVNNDSDFNAIKPSDRDRVPRIGDLLAAEGIDRKAIEEAEHNRKPDQNIGESLVSQGIASKEQVEKVAQKQQSIKAKVKSENTTRVNTERLDELINLVGELLISEAMVKQGIEQYRDTSLQQSATSMNRIVRDLQSLSMSLRMVPLKTTFRKMARAVHDTARKVNKKIKLNLVGEDTEIDRILAEKIADPLLHMVRNAADHGIEPGEDRSAAGKEEQGTITLSASQTSEHVVIELSDDGKGLDAEMLRKKAIEKGLIDSNAKLSKQECFALIFKAGFSTAKQLTGISGRGVGMDVVRRNIHDMNGIIEIDSEVGKGSTFTLRLPLTTAILDAMLIRCGSQRFLLPITSIVEANRPNEKDIEHVMNKGRIYKSRGQLLPLITLGEEFHSFGFIKEPTEAIVIVVECYNGAYALQVDEILGQQQVVIKPLNQNFDYHEGLAGSAILGDGQVGLIIDPNRMTKHKQSNNFDDSSEELEHAS